MIRIRGTDYHLLGRRYASTSKIWLETWFHIDLQYRKRVATWIIKVDVREWENILRCAPCFWWKGSLALRSSEWTYPHAKGYGIQRRRGGLITPFRVPVIPVTLRTRRIHNLCFPRGHDPPCFRADRTTGWYQHHYHRSRDGCGDGRRRENCQIRRMKRPYFDHCFICAVPFFWTATFPSDKHHL